MNKSTSSNKSFFTADDNNDIASLSNEMAAENSARRHWLAYFPATFNDKTINIDLFWTLSYRIRRNDPRQKKREKPFIITRSQANYTAFKFKNVEEYRELRKTNEELQFMEKYCGLDEFTFKFAEENPYFKVPLAADLKKYVADNGMLINDGYNKMFGEEEKKDANPKTVDRG